MCRFLKPGMKHPVTGRFMSDLEVVATNRCFYRLTVHTWNMVHMFDVCNQLTLCASLVSLVSPLFHQIRLDAF